MVAEYWRGDITARKFRVLVDGLPDDSAVAREQGGQGFTWTLAHSLLWLGVQAQARLAGWYAHVHGRPGYSPPDYTNFPWEEQDSGSGVTRGRVAEADRSAAIEYLSRLLPSRG